MTQFAERCSQRWLSLAPRESDRTSTLPHHFAPTTSDAAWSWIPSRRSHHATSGNHTHSEQQPPFHLSSAKHIPEQLFDSFPCVSLLLFLAPPSPSTIGFLRASTVLPLRFTMVPRCQNEGTLQSLPPPQEKSPKKNSPIAQQHFTLPSIECFSDSRSALLVLETQPLPLKTVRNVLAVRIL